MTRAQSWGQGHIVPTAIRVDDEYLCSGHLAALTETNPAVRCWGADLHVDVAIAGR